MNITPIIYDEIEVRHKGDKLIFIDSAKDEIHTFNVDEKALDLIKLIDGKKNNVHLFKELSNVYDDLDIEDINKVLNILLSKNIIFNNDYESYQKIDNRYSRQVIFFKNLFKSGIDRGIEVQERIKNSTVVVIGVGGLGSWVVFYLAQLGIKKLIIIDYDRVEISNLNRQIMYTLNDVGHKKIDVIEDKLKSLNPDVTLKKFDFKYLNSNDLNILEENNIDFIINCTDEPNVFTTSMLTAEFCMVRNIPHIIGGGYNHHLGMIGPTITPYKTPCLGCYELQLQLPEWHDYKLIRKRTNVAPSLNLLSSLVASIHTFEIVKVIGGLDIPLISGKKGELDFVSLNIEYEYFNRHPNCKLCGKE